MTPAQAMAAFRAAFGVAAPAGVTSRDPLTPGDLAVVARKAAVLGERAPLRRLDMLRVEIEAKPGGAVRRIGFRPNAP